jgi:hypothetical protein
LNSARLLSKKQNTGCTLSAIWSHRDVGIYLSFIYKTCGEFYVDVSGVVVQYHCCYNFKVMKLTNNTAAVWWVAGRGVVRDGFGLCVGAALIISDCYVNVCTKFYAKTGG